MNFGEACVILEIPPECRTPLCMDTLKKQYRRKVLQYHPDKNKEEGAVHQFRSVQSAYECLKKKNYVDDDEEEQNYQNVLFSFLKNVFPVNDSVLQNKIFKTIVQKLVDCCESKAVDIMEKMDKNLLVKIHTVFVNYKDVFHFSEGFLKTVEQIIANKNQKDECVILNPFLDDLWENNVYKLVENEETFLIPLWHHELVYDNVGADLYVKIIPVLPDNISIDNDNNIHVYMKYTRDELWNMKTITFEVGKRQFSFDREQLYMKEKQLINLFYQGLSKIDDKDVFDVSRRGDIIVNIEITN
jgi:hypothetical protein